MDSAKLKCIAVDDEPAALRIIEAFASRVDHLELLETFRSPLKAISFLNTQNVDLIFLDINMPDLTGIEFIQSLTTRPNIIFTTAYSEHAVESYEYEVLDYLLKPIAFPRFLKAVNKAVPSPSQHVSTDSMNGPIIIKDAGTIHKVTEGNITFLESDGNYLKVFTENMTLTIKSGLQEFLDKHQIDSLCRIHKSFAVNLQKVSRITYSDATIGGNKIPIGRKYRAEFVKLYETNQ